MRMGTNMVRQIHIHISQQMAFRQLSGSLARQSLETSPIHLANSLYSADQGTPSDYASPAHHKYRQPGGRCSRLGL